MLVRGARRQAQAQAEEETSSVGASEVAAVVGK
jgi:hypothetical protein